MSLHMIGTRFPARPSITRPATFARHSRGASSGTARTPAARTSKRSCAAKMTPLSCGDAGAIPPNPTPAIPTAELPSERWAGTAGRQHSQYRTVPAGGSSRRGAARGRRRPRCCDSGRPRWYVPARALLGWHGERDDLSRLQSVAPLPDLPLGRDIAAIGRGSYVSASPHILAAVHHQPLACDETGFAGQHEHHSVRDVVGLA